ncbi:MULTISPECIES: hypothetical protein [Acidiphilium]|nr:MULTISPECIES: hypothetical protein [Acidiphilium]
MPGKTDAAGRAWRGTPMTRIGTTRRTLPMAGHGRIGAGPA